MAVRAAEGRLHGGLDLIPPSPARWRRRLANDANQLDELCSDSAGYVQGIGVKLIGDMRSGHNVVATFDTQQHATSDNARILPILTHENGAYRCVKLLSNSLAHFVAAVSYRLI